MGNQVRATRAELADLQSPVAFLPGAKVRATRLVKNDGTFAGKEIGEVLVTKGELGYVRDVGTFLQRHYVYAVELIERGTVVGMLAGELQAVPQGEL
jgi:nitrogen fixation protein NifZ